MTDCKKRLTKRSCEEVATETPRTCPPVEFCAGNQHIRYDGQCLTAEPRDFIIPDGTYSTVTFKNGCIVGVGQAPVLTYTPNSCSGTVQASQEGSSANVVISKTPSNLLEETPDGLAVVPVFKGSGVNISGSGTHSDPFILSLSTQAGSGGGLATLTPEAVNVSTDAAGTTTVSLKPVIRSTTFSGLAINDYGQITEVDESKAAVTTVIATAPIKAEKNGEILSLSFKPASAVGSGSFRTADGKTVYYNEMGMITRVRTE